MSSLFKNQTATIKTWLKRIMYTGAILIFSLLISAWLSSSYIEHYAEGRIFDTLNTIPVNDVGLVLGANQHTKYGTMNLYFKYRMQAAATLYKSGKIKHILVSGDNHRKGYDEATDMMNYLVKLGVPKQKITLDYAGFRTFDSIVRCKEVFGQDKITIISQRFHNERALFLASSFGMDAVAYNARNVRSEYSKYQHIREFLARFKAVLDVHILFTEPKFLGKPEPIHI